MPPSEPDPFDDRTGRETGYADALAELERILADLEDDGIDIDLLGEKVARATELIRLCRDRITAARVQVERVVAELDTLSADDED
ncbi:MAG TPA: exodeoxyribonuclease VII small subunit [Acidimicrobiales bacterium]